MELLMAE